MLLIRREAYERAGITRAAIDERLNLTADEFSVEGGLVMIGPIPDDTALREILDDLEEAGLVYFEEYFELSGNWPSWIRLYVADR
jgi:DNA-binding transcriptional MocR family regulator